MSSSATSSLPAQLTPLIGREQDLTDVCDVVRRGDVRFVTLSGPGGVGKTRLALAAAGRLREDFGDGVYVVSLAAVTDPALAPPAIAHAMRIRVHGRETLIDAITRVLWDRHVLLVVDNVEHVAEAALWMEGLLGACPLARLLATSRSPLHVAAEYDYPVRPLAVPRPRDLADPEALTASPAVHMFVTSARAAGAAIELTPENARVMTAICAHVDGLPLAIELAAVRAKLLTLNELLARLERPLELLTGGRRDLPARQRTLRATIDWSYRLLSAPEREVFRTLAVFRDGFGVAAAEAICLRAQSVVDRLASLMDQGLLKTLGEQPGSGRLAMLETVRDYALERLSDSGVEPAVRERHAAHYLAIAELAAREPSSARGVAELESDQGNLRAALRWYLDGGQAEEALRLAGALWWRLWSVTGQLVEARRWLEQALAADTGRTSAVRARALAGAGILAYHQNDYETAARLCAEGLDLCTALDDRAAAGDALTGLALVARSRADFSAARSLYEEALGAFSEIGDQAGVAQTLESLGIVEWYRGNYSEARAPLERSLEIAETVGSAGAIANALQSLGWVAHCEGDDAAAEELLTRSLPGLNEMRDRWRIARTLYGLAHVAAARGDYIIARARGCEAATLAAEVGDRLLMSVCLAALAEAQPAARHEASVQVLSAAERLRAIIDAPWPTPVASAAARRLDAAREALGEESFSAAWAAGTTMSPQQALALGRTVPDAPADSIADLTSRELEVLRLVARGLTDAEVAAALVVSVRTVHSHLRSVYRKLGVSSRSAATRYAYEHELVAGRN